MVYIVPVHMAASTFQRSRAKFEGRLGGRPFNGKAIETKGSASHTMPKVLRGLYCVDIGACDWAQVWKIGGSAKPFEVTEYGNGEYRVVVMRGSTTIHDEEDLIMEWPNGPSVLWVYA